MSVSEPLQKLAQALFQVAWADDVVSPAEVHALTEVLRRLGLPLSEVLCLLDQNLTDRPQGPPVPLDQILGDRGHQLVALEALMRVCFADGVLQPAEVGYMEGLVIRMGIQADELESLRQKVLQ